MARRIRVYLDTSVISAHVDPRDPARRQLTRDLWPSLASYEACICLFVLEEIRATRDETRRAEMLALAAPFTMIPWVAEMDRLADCYLAAGAFAPALISDARHVAAAVVGGADILLSWNYRHLVNRTRRTKVNLVNAQQGYNHIEIIAPPELA